MQDLEHAHDPHGDVLPDLHHDEITLTNSVGLDRGLLSDNRPHFFCGFRLVLKHG
jgi:hypothetical protein